MGSVCVSSCRCCVFVPFVHPVAILSAVFCVICSLLMFVSGAGGVVMALYVARKVSFCLPHVEISMCFMYVSLGSSHLQCLLLFLHVVHKCVNGLYVRLSKGSPANYFCRLHTCTLTGNADYSTSPWYIYTC